MYIHISNLNRQVKEADILYLFKAYASVGHCTIHHIRNTNTREPDTYALVDMADTADTEHCVQFLNGTLLGGRKIIVQIGS